MESVGDAGKVGAVTGAGRRVYVGCLVGEDGDEVVACSQEAVERHRRWNEVQSDGPTFGDLRAAGHFDVDVLYAEQDPADSDAMDADDPFIAEGELDWSPSEQTVEEFGDLLGDLGVRDANVGMLYTPVEFVIPAQRRVEVMDRLTAAGWEVVVVDGDFLDLWYGYDE